MIFKLGSQSEKDGAARRLSNFLGSKPAVLKLDEQDLQAIQHGMPAYAVHELLGCATRVVATPTVVFEGTRESGNLALGRAYCGKPGRGYTNTGASVPAPTGMSDLLRLYRPGWICV